MSASMTNSGLTRRSFLRTAAVTTGVGFAWKSGIAGEVIAIPKDAIGTQLYDAKVYLETTDLFAWTVVIVVLSVLIEKLFTRIIQSAARKWGGAE